MMGTFLCLLSIAVIAARAESPKTSEEMYTKCREDKAANCTRPIQGENSTTTVRPEVQCREFNETKKCVEKICGQMPELVLKTAEIDLSKRNITCVAVIAARAESPKASEEMYTKCREDKAANCTRPIQGENSTTTVRPEVQCREFNETKKCVEKICGQMPELVLKNAEIDFSKRNITCVAVIPRQAESPKTPDEIYIDCGALKAANCSMTLEENGITVKPEEQCRNVIESKKCVEKICGPMPESVIKVFETQLKEKNIKCDIRSSGGTTSDKPGSSGCDGIKIDFSLVATYISFLTIIYFI